MNEHPPHTLQLEKTHPSGAEEWYCPTCGRRLVVQWPPRYKRIVLEPGDEHATHNAMKGNLHSGQIRAGAALTPPSLMPDEANVPHIEEHRLLPWVHWLESVDFDDWWRRED